MASLVLAVVPAALLLTGCRPGAGLAKLELVPKSASLVAGVDMARLRQTPLVKALRADPNRPFARVYKEMTESLGIDVLAQVDRARFGVPRAAPTDGRRRKDEVRDSITLLEGRFDPERVLAAVGRYRAKQKLPPVRSRRQGKHTIYTVTERQRVDFVFVGKTRILAGTPTLVQLALARLDGRRQGAGDAGVSARTVKALLTLPSPPELAWMRLLVPAGNRPSNGGRYTVRGADGALELANGLDLRVAFSTKSPEEAAVCAQLLAAELARLKDHPLVSLTRFRDYVERLQVSTTAERAIVRAHFDDQQLGELVALWERQLGPRWEKRKAAVRRAATAPAQD